MKWFSRTESSAPLPSTRRRTASAKGTRLSATTGPPCAQPPSGRLPSGACWSSGPGGGAGSSPCSGFGRKSPTVRLVIVEVRARDAADVLRRDPPDRRRIVRVPLPVGRGDRLGKRGRDLIGRITVEDDLRLDLRARLLRLGSASPLRARPARPPRGSPTRPTRARLPAAPARRPRTGPGRAAATARRSPKARGSSRRAPGRGARSCRLRGCCRAPRARACRDEAPRRSATRARTRRPGRTAGP